LGIPLVGKSVAKAIINYYPSWEEFREAVGGDWTEFEGFGPEISRAINNFDYSAADEIATKLTFSSNAPAEDAEKATTLDGLTFVITGKLSRKRDDIKADIENAGGKVSGSVSSKTSYLVCNDKNSTTGKSKDAKSLNVPIISEEELLKLLSGKNS
jgi:DNA ligase (NAD+)